MRLRLPFKAEEVARRTVEVTRRHTHTDARRDRGGTAHNRATPHGNGDSGGLLTDIFECLLRLTEQNGAPLLIHSVRDFFSVVRPCTVTPN
jgi:hypothetical protein